MKNEMSAVMAEDLVEPIIQQKQEQNMKQVMVPIAAVSIETSTADDAVQEEVILRNHSRAKTKSDCNESVNYLTGEDERLLEETKSALEATESFGVLTDSSQNDKQEANETCEGAVGVINSNQVKLLERKNNMLDHTNCSETYSEQEKSNLDVLSSHETLPIKSSELFLPFLLYFKRPNL